MATLQTAPQDSRAPWKNSSCSTAKRRSKEAEKLAARDALVEQHIQWARDIAAKVASKLPTWFHADDLQGAAAIALLQSASKYEAGRGVPFRAYALLHVQGACYSAARRNEYRERAHAELPAELPEEAVEDVPETDHPELPAAVWLLPVEQFRIIQLCYLHDLTVEAAAARMRISASKASQHHRAALAALRGMMAA